MPWKKKKKKKKIKKKKNYCTDYCTQNFWSIQAFFGCIELPHNQKIKLLPSHEKKSLRTYSFPIPISVWIYQRYSYISPVFRVI